MKKKRVVFTDLDGTILHRNRKFHDLDLKMFELLRRSGIPRVIATGRSFISIKRVLSDDFPIDYLIFSSGAGIMSWEKKNIERIINLTREETDLVFNLFYSRGLDFMVHHPMPDNHFFRWFDRMGGSSDFFTRIGLYEEYEERGNGDISSWNGACQFLAVIPGERKKIIDTILPELRSFTVIPTTSPLDGTSVWLEVFPNTVSKAKAASWLAGRLGARAEDCFALGNDYNDLDMLRWAGMKYVVANAPEDMRAEFPVTEKFENAAFFTSLNAHCIDMGICPE